LTARAELPTRLLSAALLASAFFVGLLAGFSPPLAIGFTLALVFLAVTMANLTVGICLFALLTFLDTILPTEAQGTLSVPKLLGLVLLLSWLALVTSGEREHRERIFSHPGFILVLLVFVGWVAISAAWAESPSAAVEAFTRYLPNAMLFLVVFAGVRTREQLLWVVGALVVGAFIGAAYGLVSPVPVDEEGRLSGALGNANETAASLVAGGALAAALAMALRGKPILRLASAIVVPLCAMAVFLTASRGGLVALATALIVAVFLAPGRRRAAAFGLGLAVVLGAVVYFGALAPAAARERVTQLSGGTGRTDIWKVGWRMVEDQPVRGIGAGNFEVSSIHYLIAPGALIRDDFIVDTPKVAHNTYLNVLAELGVIGLAMFLGIIGFSIACALKAIGVAAKAGDRQVEILARAIVVVLAALLAADFFGSRQYSKQLWLLMALCPVLLEISRAEWAARRASPEDASAALSAPRG
jgi:putative inorganic carbon (HCO3(-)) transporter